MNELVRSGFESSKFEPKFEGPSLAVSFRAKVKQSRTATAEFKFCVKNIIYLHEFHTDLSSREILSERFQLRSLLGDSMASSSVGALFSSGVVAPVVRSDYYTCGAGEFWNSQCRRRGSGGVNSAWVIRRKYSSSQCQRWRGNPTRAFSLDALMPPPIDNDLHEIMRDMGAEIDESGVVRTFGNDDQAIEAAENGVAVVDLSHFGRLRVTGEDRLHFLHNQSTADFKSLKESQGCYTVFTTPTARTIDLAKAWIMANSVILVLSPSTRYSIYDRLNKYIFFADKVEVEDITDKTDLFSIIGPSSDELLRKLNLGAIVGKPFGTHLHYKVEGNPVTVAVGGGFAGEGYSMLLSTSTSGLVWQALLQAGAVPMGADAAERLRILQGKPAPGSELTDDYNVLEAGLWKTVSLTKGRTQRFLVLNIVPGGVRRIDGAQSCILHVLFSNSPQGSDAFVTAGCYIGQETIAKLITYNGVKQQLWGIQLEVAVKPGTEIMVNGTKVGKLTSCTVGRDAGEHFGLGYIKTKFGGAGLKVHVGGVSGLVVDIPFITRSLPQ